MGALAVLVPCLLYSTMFSHRNAVLEPYIYACLVLVTDRFGSTVLCNLNYKNVYDKLYPNMIKCKVLLYIVSKI